MNNDSLVTKVADDLFVIEKVAERTRVAVRYSKDYVVVVSLDFTVGSEPYVPYLFEVDYKTSAEVKWMSTICMLLSEPYCSKYFSEAKEEYHYRKMNKMLKNNDKEVQDFIMDTLDKAIGLNIRVHGHVFYLNNRGVYSCRERFKINWQTVKQEADNDAYVIMTLVRGGVECPIAVAIDEKGERELMTMMNQYPAMDVRIYRVGNRNVELIRR